MSSEHVHAFEIAVAALLEGWLISTRSDPRVIGVLVAWVMASVVFEAWMQLAIRRWPR